MRSQHFGAQNGPFAPNENFFRKSINIFLLHLFTMQKIFKWDPELWWHVIFKPKIVHLLWGKLLQKNHLHNSDLPFVSFHCAKSFKSGFMRMCHSGAENGLTGLMDTFLGKTITIFPCISWSLSLCNIFKKFLQ